MPCGPPIWWKESQDKVFDFADTNIGSGVGNLRPSCGAGNCKRYAAEVSRSESQMRDGNLQLVSALAQLRYRYVEPSERPIRLTTSGNFANSRRCRSFLQSFFAMLQSTSLLATGRPIHGRGLDPP